MPITGEGYVVKYTSEQLSEQLHASLRIRSPKNLIIKQRTVEGKTRSGIFLGYDSRLQKVLADVLMVGKYIDEVQPLDKIWFSRYAGDEFIWSEEVLHVISINDCLAVIED